MVKQVANAHEALELLANDPKINLVFSDILMPGGMNGLELGHAIRRLYPALPVLLATGYSDSARDAVQQGFVVLHKPFELAVVMGPRVRGDDDPSVDESEWCRLIVGRRAPRGDRCTDQLHPPICGIFASAITFFHLATSALM